MPVSKEWKFDLSFLRKTHNREVYEYFKDLSPDDFEDIDIPRKAAFRACLILAKSSQLTALQKQFNFRYLIQRAWDRPHVYGMPVSQAYEEFAFKPQIQLFFRQDLDAVPEGFEPIEGELSFRILNKTSETIRESDFKQYANRIVTEFAAPGEQIWKKGKWKVCYKDLENGIDFRVLCLNKEEGIRIVKKGLKIANVDFDDDKLTPIEPNKASINNPGTRQIMGQTKKKKRWRPTGNVRFRHAIGLVDGLLRAIPLVDLSGRYLNPLV